MVSATKDVSERLSNMLEKRTREKSGNCFKYRIHEN